MNSTHKLDTQRIRDLVAALKLECSPLACLLLAYALGYKVLVWKNVAGTAWRITLEKPGARTRYTSLLVLRKALLRDARCRLVSRTREVQR